ncbi:Hypothetical predicted protein [Pelobates cultripes]|uniref:Uncharacterized protein n=1 Tax=Pelobates cultripes TaxID=61616 RepID=A0AAD1R376_PELCU|nr:Hypothetical predicted protein [Pelobates cultripes]
MMLDGERSSEESRTPLTPEDRGSKGNLTKQDALDALSSKLINSCQSSLKALQKDIHEVGNRTVHSESKMAEFATAHNDLAEHVQALEQQIATLEKKMMD